MHLYRRTLDRAVGTEDATITRFRPYQSVALNAFMKKAAGVHRHLFRCCMTALRTRQHGFERHRLRHCFAAPLCSVEGKPAFVVALTSADGFVLSPSYFTVAVLWS